MEEKNSEKNDEQDKNDRGDPDALSEVKKENAG